MKIILKSEVEHLGHVGDVVEVKPGYARNYLLPRSLAVEATPGNTRDLEKKIAAAQERARRDRETAQALAGRLTAPVRIEHRVAEDTTRLHGSVTAQEIADAVKTQLGVELDRRLLELKNPIRHLGQYQVNYRVMRGMTAPISVTVARVGEAEAPAEQPAEAAADATEEAATAEA